MTSRGWQHPASRVVLASVVAQLALVVSGPIVVRLLGIDDRGRLALVFAVAMFASQVGVVGVPAAVSWFVASRRLDAVELLARLQRRFAVQVLLASTAAAIGVLALDAAGRELAEPWLLALVVAGGTAGAMVALLGFAALQGQQRFAELAWLTPLPAVTYAIAAAVLLALGTGSVALLLAINLAGWVVVAVASLLVVRRSARVPRPGTAPSAAEVSAYARQATVATAAPIDTLGIEQLLLGLVAGTYALGLFSVGWAFETGPVVVLVALASFVGPRLSALATGQRADFAVRWLLRALVLALVVCLAIQVFLEPVLRLAFGDEALPALPLARVLVVAGVVLGLRRVTAACLVGLGEARAATWCELVGFVTMVVGVLFLLLPSVPLELVGWALAAAGAVTLLSQLLVLARALSRPAPGSGAPTAAR